jgi:hypothetical protein
MKQLIFFLLIIPGLAFAEKAFSQSHDQDGARVLEAPGSSSLLSDWIDTHMKTIKSAKVFNHHHRQSAYIGIALYESIVKGDRKYRSLADQLNGYPKPEQKVDISKICWQASANSALASMLRFFYPPDKTSFDSLENTWIQRLRKDGYSDESIRAGSQYGSYIARNVTEWSKTDGEDKINDAYTAPAGMGLWEPTPPGFIAPVMPYMGNCRTLIKGSIDNSIPPPPVSFSPDSLSSFYLMADELYKMSAKMDSTQKSTGLYWDDFPDGKSLTSGGHWATILKNIMEEQQLSLIEGSQLYAALFITTNDAGIGCFKAKYKYNVMRPVTYIQKYMEYPEWNPLIRTPSHPEYPAAHATISMSAATILTKMLGDTLSFVDDTYEYRGFKARRYKNFVEAAREAGMSRFYGGIHYRPSIEAGFEQGQKIADYIAGSLKFKQ